MKRKLPYLTKLVQKLAPKVGASFVVEPEWGVAGQIIYKNGTVRSLRFYSLDLNGVASSDIAKDKDYAKFFIKYNGYPVAPGETFFKDSWAKAIRSDRTLSQAKKYAQKLGYPVIIKPNSLSQGVGVSIAWNEKELEYGLRGIFKNDKIALLEKYLPGLDYRVVVLDHKIISAYERIPLSVSGDGKSTILSLLRKKQKDFIKSGRDTRIRFYDTRIKNRLLHQRLNLKSVLSQGEKIYLLDNANLSTGGDSKDVTKHIHPLFKKIAVTITKKMGLRMSGVDIMVTNGDITKKPAKNGYYIIEINAAPGLDHYVTSGPGQMKIVEEMYLKVLKALGKKS